MTDAPDTGDDTDRPATTRHSTVTYTIDDAEQPSTAVVRAVAAYLEASALDLEPLYDSVDPAHLNELLEGGSGRELSFTFAGCAVTATGAEVLVRGASEE